MEQTFCQSCGMPLSPEYPDHYSNNADGSRNKDYCSYCYKDGSFTQAITMDEMIEHCAKYVEEFNKDSEKKVTKEQAIEQMKAYFPKLKRWAK
jgi:hypothetical protein